MKRINLTGASMWGLLITLCCLSPEYGVFGQAAENQTKWNVLFIPVDDLNDWVGAMGNDWIKTPNLDRLAQRGLLFTNAHCSAPVCNPSRSAILSGLRPSTTGIYDNGQPMIANHPEVITIPRHFKNNGYLTLGGGKILHEAPGFAIPSDWDSYFLWNEEYRKRGWTGWYSHPPDPEPDPRPATAITEHTNRNFDWAPLDVPDSAFPDYRVASWAVDFLQQADHPPFFLAAGIFRPHVPWFNPRRFFEQYSLADIQLPPYLENDVSDIPDIAQKWALDVSSKHHLVTELGLWKEAIRGYAASISFSDAQIGRIIESLNSSPYAENTIIILWGDHGYHLGEKDHWHKFTLWERSTRVPLIIIAPGITTPGTATSRPVSLLDIYPTLVELCDLPEVKEMEGRSLVPLLKDPESEWNYPALTTHGMGNHSLRDSRWRYIRYNDGSEELYDHTSDPNEWYNLANNSQYDSVKVRLANWLPVINAPDALDYKKKEVLFDPDAYEWTVAEGSKTN